MINLLHLKSIKIIAFDTMRIISKNQEEVIFSNVNLLEHDDNDTN